MVYSYILFPNDVIYPVHSNDFLIPSLSFDVIGRISKMSARITLPKNALCTSDILHLVDEMEIPNFVGVKMRDELRGRSKRAECGIVNLKCGTREPLDLLLSIWS